MFYVILSIFAVVKFSLYTILSVMREDLEEKVRRSVLLIRHAHRHVRHRGCRLEVAYSGGKDSDVLLELCRIAGVLDSEYVRPLHRCTTIDPPFTLKHCIDNGVEILRPRRSFAGCIVASGFPTMFRRHCCGSLKEFAVEDYVVVGVRRSESVKRMKNYSSDEPEVCKVYPNGGGKSIQYLPLLDWTDDDVREFIEERGIRCHPLYYDDDGVFHVERRLGCMGCPLMYYKKRIEDFKRYPRMVRFWCRYGKIYLDSHPDVKTHQYFSDVFEWFVCNTFYNTFDDFRDRFAHDCDGKSAKEYLESYFNISLEGI